MVDLTIIILNYNTSDLTQECLTSIYKYKPKCSFEVVVVDNASSDDSVKEIKSKFPKVRLISNDKNLGFSKGNNVGVKRVYKNSKYCLLLNSDTTVLSESLTNLYNHAEKEGCDICSCKLVNKDGRFQANGGALPTFLPLFVWISGLDDIFGKYMPVVPYQGKNMDHFSGGKVGWVSGTAMMIKSEVFDQIGFLDEKIFMYGEDAEFCLRAKRANLLVCWTKEAEIVHLGGGSLTTPKYNQWLGEFRGLIYIYNKYYGALAASLLRILINFFVLLRIIAFGLLGKFSYAKTYAQIIFKI